jgi:hypothetical protein
VTGEFAARKKPCRQEGCQTPAVFAVFAEGYPAAQAVTCERHLGSALVSDMRNPGSTEAWKVKVGSWVGQNGSTAAGEQ